MSLQADICRDYKIPAKTITGASEKYNEMKKEAYSTGNQSNEILQNMLFKFEKLQLPDSDAHSQRQS